MIFKKRNFICYIVSLFLLSSACISSARAEVVYEKLNLDPNKDYIAAYPNVGEQVTGKLYHRWGLADLSAGAALTSLFINPLPTLFFSLGYACLRGAEQCRDLYSIYDLFYPRANQLCLNDGKEGVMPLSYLTALIQQSLSHPNISDADGKPFEVISHDRYLGARTLVDVLKPEADQKSLISELFAGERNKGYRGTPWYNLTPTWYSFRQIWCLSHNSSETVN